VITAGLEHMLPYGHVFGVSITGQSRASVVLGIFVIAFLGSAIPLAIRFLSKVKLNVPHVGAKAAGRAIGKSKAKAAANAAKPKTRV
jgi:hypothetical protein